MSGYISRILVLLVAVVTSACAGDSDSALDTSDPSTGTVASAICTIDALSNDVLLEEGANPFGFSINVIRGPRDCGGTRVSRDVVKKGGDGSCAVVADGSFVWANELCAHNPQLVVNNSTISAACQDFQNGGSDLGDHDCRYIVHAGAGPAIMGLQCQPSHVTSVVASCGSPLTPPNDNFANATVLSALPVSVPGTTASATREASEPDHYTENKPDAGVWLGDHSVWYQWTASSHGLVTVDVCTGAIDSIVAVYSGSTLGSLSRIVDNSNDNCGGGWGAKVTFSPSPGVRYHIAVSDAGGARENTFTLKLSQEVLVTVCGNRVVEDGEQCDDGNTRSFDQCAPDCQHACTGSLIWCDCTGEGCTTRAACDRQCSQ